jgi:hypothetical protein
MGIDLARDLHYSGLYQGVALTWDKWVLVSILYAVLYDSVTSTYNIVPFTFGRSGVRIC